jgi:hypothetical protein
VGVSRRIHLVKSPPEKALKKCSRSSILFAKYVRIESSEKPWTHLGFWPPSPETAHSILFEYIVTSEDFVGPLSCQYYFKVVLSNQFGKHKQGGWCCAKNGCLGVPYDLRKDFSDIFLRTTNGLMVRLQGLNGLLLIRSLVETTVRKADGKGAEFIVERSFYEGGNIGTI